MIKTGQTTNVLLGVGDSSKFNLLGGSFGEAGDVVFGPYSGGGRFLPEKKKQPTSGYGSGGRAPGVGTPTIPRRPGDGFDPNRYNRER